MSEIFEGDNGTAIEITITDDTGAVNLATATSITAKFRRPDRSEFTRVLSTVDAAAGKCSATLTSEHVSISGQYTMQVTVHFDDGDIFSSDKQQFVVGSKL